MVILPLAGGAGPPATAGAGAAEGQQASWVSADAPANWVSADPPAQEYDKTKKFSPLAPRREESTQELEDIGMPLEDRVTFEVSHGWCGQLHAPLYVSFVILHTKQTGGRENGLTARG